MAIDDFVPEVWSTLLVENLLERQSITSIFNTDYEGEITGSGDTVRINKYTGTTVSDYTGGTITYDAVNSSQVSLLIDKAKYMAVNVDDVDAIQANISFDAPIIRDFADKLQQQRNIDLFQAIIDDCPTANIWDASSAIDLDDFKDAQVIFDKANVRNSGRFCFINPDGNGDLLGNQNIIDASKYGSDVALKEGEIGMLYGFRIVMTNDVANTTATPAQTQIIFAHEDAVAFASQKSFTVEAARAENTFGDNMRTLNMYGAKAIQTAALAIVYRDI
jgi:N4-gp56 family major capsid protein